jgi:hypothetical protein
VHGTRRKANNRFFPQFSALSSYLTNQTNKTNQTVR